MDSYDLLVIGGGINGAGIARDAAGRGLKVLLVEKDDLSAHTSASSSKLIHGGLRYLEHYEFRLVAEALAEREVLLKVARHLVWPARFVMPHVPELRPRWMIRAGLFLYDHMGRLAPTLESQRASLPVSHAVRLDAPPYNAVLKPEFRHGFVYSDCRVDDARLVVSNAMDAQRRGAEIRTRTECVAARRESDSWRATLSGGRVVSARAIVNAAGPWVKQVLNDRLGQPSQDGIKLVKGSHVVLPQLYRGDHAFILQNDDRRVVFMIPYGDRHTLVGTTDVPFEGDAATASASDAEVEYLCRAAGRYLARPVNPAEVAWRYAGVRPLYDDGTADPSAVTRDYTLRVDADAGSSPVLSVYGGKITTYRRLAEHALRDLAPFFPELKGEWTATEPLIGADFGELEREEARDMFFARYGLLPQEHLRGIFRRHGMLAYDVLGSARALEDLGEYFGAGLYAKEVDYFVAQEWAVTAEDVLWRRTKAGLHLTGAQREAVLRHMGRVS